MLSANKIKLHGMSDTRWTVKDKLSQYKGLVTLYNRDNKVLQHDATVARKQQIRLIQQVSRDIVADRKKLDNAIGGDKQKLRNSLQEHRDLQLAFQNLDPEKVVENVHQNNFNKRKELDRMIYQMKLKRQRLIDVKMNLAALEDREIYGDILGQLPTEKQAEVITGRVQNAILKQEAAISVRCTYKSVLDILKKDSYYFDAVLNALKLDLSNQSNCLYRATELGQLATEYLDDRKTELILLEEAVLNDRTMKQKSIEVVKEQVKAITKNVKELIRRDSDVNIPTKGLTKTNSDDVLIDNIEEFDRILANLQQVLLVPHFEALYPCLMNQQKHQEELGTLVATLKEACRILENKKKHSEVILNNHRYSMVDTTLEYITKKKQLLEQINEKEEELELVKSKILKRGNISVKIRSSLQQIKYLLQAVATESERRQVTLPESSPRDVESDDLDVNQLLATLRMKLQILSSAAAGGLTAATRDAAETNYTDMILKSCKTVTIIEEVKIEDLLDHLILEDATILNRADIKKQSKEIIEYNLQLEAELFAPPPVKKKR